VADADINLWRVHRDRRRGPMWTTPWA